MNGFTIAGHIAIDQIIHEKDSYYQLGGPPTYASTLAELFGFPIKLVTKIGYDFMDELLPESMVIDESMKSSSPTTRFVIDYRVQPRKMMVPTRCEPLDPLTLGEEKVLLCPIVDEIDDDYIQSIDTGFLALDPQGLLRKINNDQTVSQKTWQNPESLGRLNLLKTSIDEHHLITGARDIEKSLRTMMKHGVEYAVITDGTTGAYAYSRDGFYKIPAYSVDAVDTTGAGDVFLAGLASHIDEGFLWGCAVGAASGSALVETRGAIIKRDHKEILERAEKIYDDIQHLG